MLPSSSVKTADSTSLLVLSSCNCCTVADRLDVGGVRAYACAEFDKKEAVEAFEFIVDPPLLVHPCCTTLTTQQARAGSDIIFCRQGQVAIMWSMAPQILQVHGLAAAKEQMVTRILSSMFK